MYYPIENIVIQQPTHYSALSNHLIVVRISTNVYNTRIRQHLLAKISDNVRSNPHDIIYNLHCS